MQLAVFPNPANDEIRIQYDVQKTDGAHLKFFNVYGQLSKVVLLPEARGTVLTPTNNLASGVYFYTLRWSHGWQSDHQPLIFVKITAHLKKIFRCADLSF
jgi:hypothetical protein